MEDGNLDDLPPDVFVRGFIRSYAKTLGISSSEPLGMLDQTLTERRRDPMSPSAVLVESPARGRKPEAARLLPSEPTGEDEVPVPHRGIGLAVFVIIVLLIATITLSLFLRQQPQSGEGLSLGSGDLQSGDPAPALLTTALHG
jgi:cytoskeletal protein RodZ